MAKTRISSIELAWILTERLRAIGIVAAIAIVPSKEGWSAVASKGGYAKGDRTKLVAQTQKQLRKVYALAKD